MLREFVSLPRGRTAEDVSRRIQDTVSKMRSIGLKGLSLPVGFPDEKRTLTDINGDIDLIKAS